MVCSGCKLDFCLRCANISASLWECITKGELDNFIWSCRSCRATFPSLVNISKVLGDIKTSTNSRMDKFEERLGTIEERTNEEIKNYVSSMKTEIIESLQGNLESLVDSRTKELEDRKRCDTNLIIFNVPEHRLPRGEDNKIKDIEDTQNLSSSLGLENLHIAHCFRLGKKTQTSSRPLKLVLEIRSQRKFLLDNAKFVPEKAPIHLRQAIIVKDMTPKQREERRARRRNRNRVENVEIEEGAPLPRNLNASNTMDTGDHHTLSPILGNGNLQNRHFQNATLSLINSCF